MRRPSVAMVGTRPAMTFNRRHRVPKNGWVNRSCVRARVSLRWRLPVLVILILFISNHAHQKGTTEGMNRRDLSSWSRLSDRQEHHGRII